MKRKAQASIRRLASPKSARTAGRGAAGSAYKVFVGVSPGLESLLSSELASLSRPLRSGVVWRPHDGGLEATVSREDMWTIAWHSRLAESLRVRLHDSPFVSKNFRQFASQLAKLPWTDYLPPIETNSSGKESVVLPRVQVTCKKSALYHSGAVKERVENQLRSLYGLAPKESDESDTPDELDNSSDDPTSASYDDAESDLLPRFFVRIVNDRVEVSVDASGELLHRRGIRQHVSDAPLRETIAAACLRAAGWTREEFMKKDGPTAIWDPFAGAGTILLEALGMTLHGHRPAQLPSRTFAFERWKSHPTAAYAAYVKDIFSTKEEEIPKSRGTVAIGSDIDPKCIRSALHNAQLGGFDPASYSFVEGDFEQAEARVPPNAVVVTNPPYGVRSLPQGQTLPALFRRFERMLLRRTDLTQVIVLNGYKDFVHCMKETKWSVLYRFTNRGLPVQILKLERR